MGDDYFVVTAEHVVTECAESGFIRASNASVGVFYLEMVSIDGRYWLSTAVGDRDLALLAASKKIPALKFQSTEPQIGQWVAAFGFPISFETGGLSVTQGHLSGVESSGHLLTDAAINSGNSGGPAVNSRGEVVGTVFASDPNDKSDNIGYLQGKGQHCGLVFQCDGDTIFYVPPLEQIKFVSE
jgi:S1-C subfamily serine protease